MIYLEKRIFWRLIMFLFITATGFSWAFPTFSFPTVTMTATRTLAATPTVTATATRTTATTLTPSPTPAISPAATPVATTGTGGVALLIQAEDYTSYADSTSGNSGGCYRSDDVDIESCSEGGFDVGWIVSGEWLEYTVTIPKTEAYNLYFRVASPSFVSPAFGVTVDGISIASGLAVQNTMSWQVWTDTVINSVNLTAGTRKIRVNATAGFNFNYIFIRSVSNAPTPTPIPGSQPTPAKPIGYTSVVDTYGQLKVIGTKLCDKNGNQIQLKGMSSHGLQYFPFVKGHTIANLAYTWGIDVIRPAMYVEDYKNGEFIGGYIAQPEFMRTKAIEYINDAITTGIYVLIDWHLHNNPKNYQTEAIAFYQYMASLYGNKANVIYEICNEPEYTSWDDIKSYANAVIPVIRALDPDNIILVGTPNWCQDINVAADSPLTGYTNIMYTMHFYAGSHTQWLRDRVTYALGKGLPIFCSEWGTSDSTGGTNQTLYLTEALTWVNFLNTNKISWINWSFCNKGESSAALKPGVGLLGPWPDTDISASGLFVKPKM